MCEGLRPFTVSIYYTTYILSFHLVLFIATHKSISATQNMAEHYPKERSIGRGGTDNKTQHIFKHLYRYTFVYECNVWPSCCRCGVVVCHKVVAQTTTHNNDVWSGQRERWGWWRTPQWGDNAMTTTHRSAADQTSSPFVASQMMTNNLTTNTTQHYASRLCSYTPNHNSLTSNIT